MVFLIYLMFKTRGVTEYSNLYLCFETFFLLPVPFYLSLMMLYFLYLLVPLLGAAPPVRLRETGHSQAMRPHGEGRGTGGEGPRSVSVLGRVERPQRGLGCSPSLLLSARRLIGTVLDSCMGASEECKKISI